MEVYSQEWNWLLLLGFLGALTHPYFNTGEKPVLGEYLGELILSSNYIELANTKVYIDEIDDLKLEFSHFKNEKVYNRYSLFYYLSGTENQITLKTKNETLSYNFMILNRNHKRDILEVLPYYYEHGIFVKEFGNGRTYLGKDLSYEEIQEFKANYKLKGSGYNSII